MCTRKDKVRKVHMALIRDRERNNTVRRLETKKIEAVIACAICYRSCRVAQLISEKFAKRTCRTLLHGYNG